MRGPLNAQIQKHAIFSIMSMFRSKIFTLSLRLQKLVAQSLVISLRSAYPVMALGLDPCPLGACYNFRILTQDLIMTCES